MSDNSRRRLSAYLLVLSLSIRAAAGVVSIPQANMQSTLGGAGAPLIQLPGALPGASASLSLMPAGSKMTPILSVMPLPVVTPVQQALVVRAAAGLTATPAQRLAPVISALERVVDSGSARDIFDGKRGAASAQTDDFIINDEGVRISGRAALYYKETRRMVELYKGKIDFSESVDVMDDAYADVLAKVSAVEAVAHGRGLSQENTHLEKTLTWVDGLLTDGVKKVAVHTHRVFFHKAPNRESEIAEGIRRVDAYIADSEAMFARGGKAESQMGKLDEVELVFDPRGYQEIKDYIMKRGAELTARTKGRITFKFLDELAPLPKDQAAIRAQLNELAQRYNGEGLSKIYEGVIYSRYVGLLLELKTAEYYYKLGYKVLQSGRELYDENGMYITELDAVVESPEGKVILIEAKSARVDLPFEEVLKDKILYKLATYKKYRVQLEKMVGKKIDGVVFSMDVGLDPAAASPSHPTESDRRKRELVEFLRAKRPKLSADYGYPVDFLFLSSGPSARR
jgi:hypothetical protein